MTSLQDAVQEYLKAPPANTLPQLLFIHPSGRGYAPDVGGCHRDVGSGLVRPGIPGFQEIQSNHLEDSRTGCNRHS